MSSGTLTFSSFGANTGEKYPKQGKGGRKLATTFLFCPTSQLMIGR
jgi:hypothetical protein